MSTNTMERVTSPDVVALQGCMDVDGHEMIPMHMWPDVFGEGGAAFLAACPHSDFLENGAENTMRRDDVTDHLEINEHNVWTVRGVEAPGAIDFDRRVPVMDFMGVNRQLVYGSFSAVGLSMMTHADAHIFFRYDPANVDRLKLAKQVVNSHNDWALGIARKYGSERMRPVAIVLTDDLESMMVDGRRFIDGGIRAVVLPNGTPPAGTSPADVRLDPFWKMFADANVAVTMHIGSEFSLLSSLKWDTNVPAFAPATSSSAEFPVQPYWGSTLNFASENYLTAMVLGGVFERIPHLRFGSIEAGAQWLGPLADRLDLWAGEFRKRLAPLLSMKPSAYINRNVRVSPFHFEDVALYFQRYPHLADSFCFSTDYPHREGGKFAKQTFYDKLSKLNDRKVISKFFIENGAWLLPD